MSGDLHTAWAHTFAAALAAAGVEHAVICPGSRSTPLALALAAHLPFTVLHDERAGAFFALGRARASGSPALLLTTSGTAAAHALPAVIEASHAALPLLVLSADRPWELRAARASQTIDQVKLFGDQVRAFFELGLPDEAPDAQAALPRLAAQAVLATRWPVPGPVHVNASFRRPLEPRPGAASARPRRAIRLLPPTAAPSPDAIDALVQLCVSARRPLVVAGPCSPAEGRALREVLPAFLAATGSSFAAESTSQLRFGGPPGTLGALEALGAPDLVIELGAPLVTPALRALLLTSPRPRHVALPGLQIADPHGTAELILLGDAAALLSSATAAFQGPRAVEPGWAAALQAADERAFATRAALVAAAGEGLREEHVAPLLLAALPAGAFLCVGNSGPVRDLDADVPPSRRALTVLHQRGAAGIDGLVAGAAGSAAVLPEPGALLLGDVSLLHDAGGLAALATLRRGFPVVVVHNDGGRIFERLPLGARPELAGALEQLFVAPHGRSFAGLAATWELGHSVARTPAALSDAIRAALAADRPAIIEAHVAPGGSARRSALTAAMRAAAGCQP